MKKTLSNFLPLNQTLRSLTNNLLDEYFMPYGCWCNFDEDMTNMPGKGRGTPKDDWDESCRQLQEGYRCAMMDAEARGELCEPWNQVYPSPGHALDQSFIRPVCEMVASTTQDQCTIDACIVETFFVDRVAHAIIPGAAVGFTNLDRIDDNYMHANGFVPEMECIKHGRGSVEKECCGVHPRRFPYGVVNKMCCNGIVTVGTNLC